MHGLHWSSRCLLPAGKLDALSFFACTEVALGTHLAISGHGQGLAVQDAVSICSQLHFD